MTETTQVDTEQQLREPVVPEGIDPIDGLTVRELDAICSGMRCDVMSALADEGMGAGRRWAAMARIGHAWEKRTDPKAKLDPWFDLSGVELARLIRFDGSGDDDDQGEEDTDANPTAHTLE